MTEEAVEERINLEIAKKDEIDSGKQKLARATPLEACSRGHTLVQHVKSIAS